MEVLAKSSARRSLSAWLGEADPEQNRKDLAAWNDHFDALFAQRWGIDPKSGRFLPNSTLDWEVVSVNEAVSSGPCAGLTSPLTCATSHTDVHFCPSEGLDVKVNVKHQALSDSSVLNNLDSSQTGVHRKCLSCPSGDTSGAATRSQSPCSTTTDSSCGSVTKCSSSSSENKCSPLHAPLKKPFISNKQRRNRHKLVSTGLEKRLHKRKGLSVCGNEKQRSIADYFPRRKKLCSTSIKVQQ